MGTRPDPTTALAAFDPKMSGVQVRFRNLEVLLGTVALPPGREWLTEEGGMEYLEYILLYGVWGGVQSTA